MSKLERKDYYENFGKHLKNFLVDEFGSIKKAAQRLGYNSPATLSQYINGHNYPSRKFENDIRMLGFDMEHFEKIRIIDEIKDIETVGLTWEQVKFVVQELKALVRDKNQTIENQRNVIRIYETRVKELNRKLSGKHSL